MNDVAAGVAGVDAIKTILEKLVRERQELRSWSVDRAELEANRRSILYWQLRLSAALAAEHGAHQPAA